jgi:hypothetical protein
MSNMSNMIDIASTKFVENMTDETKQYVNSRFGFCFSNIEPENVLIEMGWDYKVDEQLFDDYFRAILAKMSEQNIDYKVSSSYEYLN